MACNTLSWQFNLKLNLGLYCNSLCERHLCLGHDFPAHSLVPSQIISLISISSNTQTKTIPPTTTLVLGFYVFAFISHVCGTIASNSHTIGHLFFVHVFVDGALLLMLLCVFVVYYEVACLSGMHHRPTWLMRYIFAYNKRDATLQGFGGSFTGTELLALISAATKGYELRDQTRANRNPCPLSPSGFAWRPRVSIHSPESSTRRCGHPILILRNSNLQFAHVLIPLSLAFVSFLVCLWITVF